LKGARQQPKKNITLISIILMLSVSLFFYLFFDTEAQAKKNSDKEVPLAEVDPLHKIGKGLVPLEKKCQKANSACDEIILAQEKISGSVEKSKARKIVAGHPIEKMLNAIYEQDKKVAAYLLAIGNKESKWGTHAPQKDGRDCYNYWGYRGGYNPTESGYSCFDSPEQAVETVGQRIENLLSQNIDTPQEMVVWKCGTDCSWDNPQAVQKWIADVDYFLKKLDK
jgi:hypothetical protein